MNWFIIPLGGVTDIMKVSQAYVSRVCVTKRNKFLINLRETKINHLLRVDYEIDSAYAFMICY